MRIQDQLTQYRKFVKDCRDNWDCDGIGSHHISTTCRACKAETLLSVIDDKVPSRRSAPVNRPDVYDPSRS